MTRTIWIPAHPRRLPKKPDAFARVHLELAEAYYRERLYAEQLEARLAEELEREFSEAAE